MARAACKFIVHFSMSFCTTRPTIPSFQKNGTLLSCRPYRCWACAIAQQLDESNRRRQIGFTCQGRSARLDQLYLHSKKTEPCSLAAPTDAGPVPLPSNLTSPTEDVTSFVSKHHDPWTQ